MRANIGIDELVMRLRRMVRCGSRNAVVNVQFSRFKYIRSNGRLLMVQLNGVKDLATHYGAECYILGNVDAFIIFDEADIGKAQEVADRLTANIFPDREESDVGDEAVAVVYNIPADYAGLRRRVEDYQNILEEGEAASPAAPGQASDVLEGPLTPALVGQLHGLIDEIDIRPFVRTQTVYQAGAQGAWSPVYSEYYTSICDLRDHLFPKVHLRGHRNLFNEFCQRLDAKMFTVVASRRLQFAGKRVSVNVGIDSIASPGFLACSKALKSGDGQTHLLEISAHALLEDVDASARAIDAAHGLGFDIVVDGITMDMIPYINLSRFRAAFYKILAVREHLALLGQSEHLSALRRLGSGIIFCRCDHPSTVKIGQTLGIDKFQGWLLDKEMATERTE